MGELARALDKDSLQEVLQRCEAASLVALMQTCKYMRSLIICNSPIWEQKLWDDFGWEPGRGLSQQTGESLFDRCEYRDIYCSFRSKKITECVRFRGFYTNGGVDGDNEEYWLDNAFRNDHSPYCSNATSNVDIVGVLLDNYEDQIRLEQNIRNFMRDRCYLAAEWLIHLNQTQIRRAHLEDEILSVDQLSDLQLKNFFCSLFESYNQGSPLGHFLFIDVGDNFEEEVRRVRDTVSILQQQRNDIRNSITGINSDIKFDRNILNCTQKGCLASCAVKTIEIGRMGQLTCPVLNGMVFGCDVAKVKARGLDISFHEKLSDSIECLSEFDHLDSVDLVLEKSKRGAIPAIEHMTIMKSDSTVGGCFLEFKREKRNQKDLIFVWHPIGWFSFDSEESRKLRAMQNSKGVGEIHYVTPQSGSQDDKSISCMIVVTLIRKISINFLGVKLINQENLMEQMLDEHDHPNIDLSRIKVSGTVLV